MYQVDRAPQRKRRRRWPWVLLALLALVAFGVWWVVVHLQPKTTITQSKVVTQKVAYTSKTKHYDETDFGIDVPRDWVKLARPPGGYQSFTWQSPDRAAGTQVIEIFEDILPTNFATNRALIVEGQGDHVTLNGEASEKCNTFTKTASDGSANTPVPAKWLDTDFICDRSTTSRDSIATSSKDGVNKVILQKSDGSKHVFFFTYVNYNINPDYTIFYSALTSFKMQ